MRDAFNAARGFWTGWAVLAVLSLVQEFSGHHGYAMMLAVGAAILGWIGYGIWMKQQ